MEELLLAGALTSSSSSGMLCAVDLRLEVSAAELLQGESGMEA